MKLNHLLLAAAIVALPASAFAQSTYHQRHDINARKEISSPASTRARAAATDAA